MLATATVAITAHPGTAFAEEQSVHFNIPAQDLASALQAFAEISRRQIVFDRATLKGKRNAALIGTWTWLPNRVGLAWFLDEVSPLLPQDIRVAVAGRVPPDLQAPGNVTLVGRVPAADLFLRSCRMVALSSRAGTGVQLKTIETMQLGLPAVATALSCRGFTALPENFTLADSPADFARALVERVAQIREGAAQRLDGAAFLARQRAALAAGIAQGLAAARG